MATNLGALPTNQPMPGNKVQIKRGAVDGAIYYSSANNGQKITDGAGGYMEITYTPTYACYWIVKSNIMAHGYADTTGWRRWDHSIYISPADADGVTQGFQCPHQLYDNTTVEWRSVTGSAMFKLAAGVAYTAYLATSHVSASYANVHYGPTWTRIVGRIVGEGNV